MRKGIIEIFEQIPDPRQGNAIRHRLTDVLVIGVLSILCGMEHFTEMEMFAYEQSEWLRKFLPLENGVPSHDTFGDVFAVVDSEALTQAFAEWVESLRIKVSGEVVAIDGKTIRASRDTAKGKKAVHIVSAWASQNHLILGELATEEKSNEITAIPQLLDMLNVKGCTVTIDAMGTQAKIAAKILERGGDYLLPVKENQPQLHADIALFFEDQPNDLDFAETKDQGHGRIETRNCVVSRDVAWLDPEKKWTGLAGIAKLSAENIDTFTGLTQSAVHYLIFSGNLSAAQILDAKRAHWGVESMHWSLDIAFREDMCRVRSGNAAKNFNAMRHLTLNLLNLEKTGKGGIATKRRRCAISPTYRELVLGLSSTISTIS
jgi:predicted transposase YbfD/YdcC